MEKKTTLKDKPIKNTAYENKKTVTGTAKPSIKKTWSKPGFKTTEFWAATLITLLGVIKQAGLPAWTVPIVWAGYGIARGLSKMGGYEINEK